MSFWCVTKQRRQNILLIPFSGLRAELRQGASGSLGNARLGRDRRMARPSPDEPTPALLTPRSPGSAERLSLARVGPSNVTLAILPSNG